MDWEDREIKRLYPEDHTSEPPEMLGRYCVGVLDRDGVIVFEGERDGTKLIVPDQKSADGASVDSSLT